MSSCTTGFDSFWSAWPANSGGYTRKGAKSECRRRWEAKGYDASADEIVRHVEWLKTTADWQKDGGAYIPAPLVYLNQQRWDGAEIPASKQDLEKAARDAEDRRVQEYIARTTGQKLRSVG